jgi:hypothetical protein
MCISLRFTVSINDIKFSDYESFISLLFKLKSMKELKREKYLSKIRPFYNDKDKN